MADYSGNGWTTIFKMGGAPMKLPQELTKVWWDKKKQLVAKTHATGVGEALDGLKKTFEKVDWIWLTAGRPSAMKDDVERAKKFITGSQIAALRNELKTVRDLAKSEAVGMKKSALTKKTGDTLTEMAGVADFLFVAVNPNSMSGHLAEAVKDWDAKIKAKFLAFAKPNLEASKKVVTKIPSAMTDVKSALKEYVAEQGDEEAKKKKLTTVGDKVRSLCRDMTQPLGNLDKNHQSGAPFVGYDDAGVVRLKNEMTKVADSKSGGEVVEGMDAKKATELVVQLDGWSKRFVALVKDVTI
jgi:hypothetical protein